MSGASKSQCHCSQLAGKSCDAEKLAAPNCSADTTTTSWAFRACAMCSRNCLEEDFATVVAGTNNAPERRTHRGGAAGTCSAFLAPCSVNTGEIDAETHLQTLTVTKPSNGKQSLCPCRKGLALRPRGMMRLKLECVTSLGSNACASLGQNAKSGLWWDPKT